MEILKNYQVKISSKVQITANYDVSIAVPYASLPLQELSLQLSAKTLSDSFSATTIKTFTDAKIGESISGTVLDYNYDFKINETSESGDQISLSGRYSSDKLLYTAYSWEIPMNEKLGFHNGIPIFNASSYLRSICQNLGFTAKTYFMDFAVKSGNTQSGSTYQQFISSLFGWLSDLPHIDYNVFLRNGKLFVVQRGRERNCISAGDGAVITITDEANVGGYPTTATRQIRTEWAGKVGWKDAKNIQDEQEAEPVPFTGTIAYGEASLTYENGFLMQRQDGEKTTIYEYITINDQKYLRKEETLDEETETADKTEYDYVENNDVLYLAKETRYTGGEYVDEQVNYDNAVVVITEKTPLGNGWYGIRTENKDTGAVVTSLTQGSPANSVSPYTLKETQKQISDFASTMREMRDRILAKLLGVPLISTNYPIDSYFGRSEIVHLAQETDWLDNAFEETITMTVYNVKRNNIPHVIDFTDLIYYHSNYYCLESNNIRQDGDGTVQSIVIKRWYKGNVKRPLA